MATLSINVAGDGVARMIAAANILSNRVSDAARRALNHTGDKAKTQVKRAISQQIKAPQSAIAKYSRIHGKRASYGGLHYEIVCRGGPIPLKHFKAYQTKAGVSAAPWGNRKVYKSAFMSAGLGGHAFWRAGRARFPIERIAGPNVPKEMVKGQSAAAFRAAAAAFPPRLAHEIRAITNGVVS